MRWVRAKRILLRPFENLSSLERFVQIVRLGSTMLIVIVGIVITAGPRTLPTKLYMSKLNTYTADISNGIFEALESSIESSGSTGINNGVGLTTSEILILTSYISSQLTDIPEFVIATLYQQCRGTSDYEEVIFPNGYMETIRNSTISVSCSSPSFSFIFDYRDLLEVLGLNIVLEYAYGTAAASEDYQRYISKRRNLKVDILRLLYFVIGLEFLNLNLMIWYYSIKGRFINIMTETVLLHLMSFLALVGFICGLICIISLTWINLSLQDKVKNELQAFGFSYHLGSAWFVCVWLLVGLLAVSCLICTGLEWCIAEVDDEPETGNEQILGSYKSGFFTNPIVDEDEREIDEEEVPDEDIPDEEFELHSLISATVNEPEDYDSDINLQKPIVPSSTMHF
ncbi:hypothetical protein KAFR_0E04190 [Kazachstania africana CBS 2517]|uniref:Protein ECM7 n=1 Tax=Kazachstania africana (strain ATCC 22294 / BCRC 22015 / CBS 2517 / CECT 1963 / NBRC 1671 / NRRL Y-8276) TaxID=1071382 RepID=H2AW20_KAZAF|nr:hypothetical protein KAFR_0E04190 [Kazachstania africana CBS 2517]CCF58570.1 hypothetical protein KAFR_0E04190 [Kazachstania africana CBS 2517]